MAKQKKKNRPAQTREAKQSVADPIKKSNLFPFLPDFRSQAIFIALLGAVFYFNTLGNEYALDDDIIIIKNQYVQDGISGIGKIMTKDAFDSFYSQMQAGGQLAGGRYRPLSIATFAIEKQFFDNNPVVRHFVNMALFILSMIVLLNLLRNYFFRSLPDLAFLTTLIFTIHPIHTEVVANVKSRDEIMSFLFICLTFIYAFRWQDDKKIWTLLKSALCYFLALLSKEWGITLVLLIPLSFYIFRQYSLWKSLSASAPFFAVALVYLAMHIGFVGMGSSEGDKEILNNPYLWAGPVQKLATKIYVLGKYLFLLFFPFHLSADYSYNTIHYRSFANADVWLSFFVHLAMIILAFVLLSKRHFISFALFFYLGHLALVSNFKFNVGATMGERLIYHSSLGFAIITAWALLGALKRIPAVNLQKSVLYLTLVPLIGLFGFKTIERNTHWKNDRTLFIHDAKVVPEAILANGNAGKSFIQMAEDAAGNKDTILRNRYLDSALFYLERSVNVHKGYYIGYINLGYIAFMRNDFEKCEQYWNKADAQFPRKGHTNYWKTYDIPLAQAFHRLGLNAGMKKDFAVAEKNLSKAVAYEPGNAAYWADYGGANFELKNYQKALECWTRALQIDPNNQAARGGYKALSGKDWPQ